ncbi:MAG: hypothetical protein AAFQ87_01430 [Bacteroidota bacterium]
MAELLQHILSLPQIEQLAIVQAIVSNLQSNDPEAQDILDKQVAYAEQIARQIDQNEMKSIPLHDFQKEMQTRREKRG